MLHIALSVPTRLTCSQMSRRVIRGQVSYRAYLFQRSSEQIVEFMRITCEHLDDYDCFAAHRADLQSPAEPVLVRVRHQVRVEPPRLHGKVAHDRDP